MKRDYGIFSKEDFVELLEKYEADPLFRHRAYQDLLQIRLTKIDAQIESVLRTEKKLSLQLKREKNLKNRKNIHESLCATQARYEILCAERQIFEDCAIHL
ncbi:MAG: hypothetical protein Q4A78_11995 [Peptostreptococcaceae bacterium]|nr:hypothetical protein [Peptostreptococcaceae bacterium]